MSDQPDVLKALKAADALIDNLWEAVPWGQTFNLDIAALNTVPPMIKQAIADAERSYVEHLVPDRLKDIAFQCGLIIKDDSGREEPFDGQWASFAKAIAACVLAKPVDPTAAANTQNTMIVMLNALQVAKYAIEEWEKNDYAPRMDVSIDEQGLIQAKKALDQAVTLAQKELKL